MAKNENFKKAKKEKNDEFYTQLTDIERELRHYKKHFKDKTVFCNCDDPEYSNFWQYFSLNFEELRLKKLIATHYETKKQSYMLEMWKDEAGVHSGIKTLKENGDFRSPESIALLQEADIVVTNPPFSLFREYIAQLVKKKKKFLIIGNNNAITYKEFFPMLKENKVWLGYSANKTFTFQMADDYELSGKGAYQDKETGKKYCKVPAITWYTNLDIDKRHENLTLYKKYSPDEYPKYDNYDAIEVSKVSDIPCDYDGVMGVPITFMDKYNPNQFKILGITQRNDDPYKIKHYTTEEYENANDLNARAVIIQKSGIPKSVYARILIKRKEKQGNEN